MIYTYIYIVVYVETICTLTIPLIVNDMFVMEASLSKSTITNVMQLGFILM